MFGWRGFHDILPTTKGLYSRNVAAHSNCPLCGFGEDSNGHAVFWCPFSQELWTLIRVWWVIKKKSLLKVHYYMLQNSLRKNPLLKC